MSLSTPSKITLYLSPGACSLAPHILLHEVGATFSTTSFSVTQGIPADFVKINPKMRIPALVLNYQDTSEELVITEAPAIMTTIAQMAPEMQLLGRTPLEVVRTYEWINYLSSYIHAVGFGMILGPGRFSDDEKSWQAVREKGVRTVKEAFEMVEGKLMEGKWAVGGDFTVVDVYLLVFWRWGLEVGFVKEGRWGKYGQLMERVLEREAVRRALRDEGLEPKPKPRI